MEEIQKVINKLEDANRALLFLDRKYLTLEKWGRITVEINAVIWDLKEKVKDQEGRCATQKGAGHEL